MQIQVNTDDNIPGFDGLTQDVQTQVEAVLGRFSGQITRVEVHLSDTNAAKAGGADKRCMMEIRLAGQQPLAVTHMAANLPEAYRGAAEKAKSRVESTLGKLANVKGGTSIKDGMLTED